jgi:ketosteroid isomerase-like protein
MSQENVEVVRRSFEVWNEGDLEAIRSLYANDAVIQTPDGLTNQGGTSMGDDPVGRWLAELREVWSQWRLEVERIFEKGEAVVSFYRALSVGRSSGAEVVRDLAGVYRIRDGLIANERIFLDRGEALEAAGLRE